MCGDANDVNTSANFICKCYKTVLCIFLKQKIDIWVKYKIKGTEFISALVPYLQRLWNELFHKIGFKSTCSSFFLGNHCSSEEVLTRSFFNPIGLVKISKVWLFLAEVVSNIYIFAWYIYECMYGAYCLNYMWFVLYIYICYNKLLVPYNRLRIVCIHVELCCRHLRTAPTQSSSTQQKEKMILWWKTLQEMCSQIQSPFLLW